MGDVIMKDGQLTAEADDIFEDVAAATGLPPETIKSMAAELREAINAAGGIDCSEEQADEAWAAIQRKYGVPEHAIEPEHMRRH